MSSPANATRDESLARYLSSLELAGLSEATGPSTRALTGALLFIDISGFTALTEQFTSRGPLGAELLSEALNRYFGVMIDVAAEHGGDVHVFAGDALLIVFDAADDARSDAIVRNAARAAFSIRQRLDGSEPVQGTTLKLRLTLGCGNLLAHRIGGVDGRWSTKRQARHSRTAACGSRACPPNPRPSRPCHANASARATWSESNWSRSS